MSAYNPTYDKLTPFGKCVIDEFVQFHSARIRDGIPPSVISSGYEVKNNSPEMSQAKTNIRDIFLTMIGIDRLVTTLKENDMNESIVLHYCRGVHQSGGPYTGSQSLPTTTVKPTAPRAQQEGPPRR